MTCWIGPAPLPRLQLEEAVRAVHVTVTWVVSLHVESPSLTTRLIVAVPAAVQVKRVEDVVVSVRAPEVADHVYETGAGALSASWAAATSATEPPTKTSSGVAVTPSICGHTLMAPVARMEPLV